MLNNIPKQALPDFTNTQVAFAHRSNKELRKTAWLFLILNKPWLVDASSQMGLWALNNNLPFVEGIIRATIFDQFCGGTSVEDCQLTITRLASRGVATVLDYGAEGKTSEEDFNASMEELLRAIDFAADRPDVPVVSMKLTGLVKFDVLAKIQAGVALDAPEQESYLNLLKRLKFIGKAATEKNVCLFVDAEESWIQDTIDDLTDKMMEQYNTQRAIVFNTFQMYRHDRLDFLKASYEKARKGGYILGAKIVRGAYMEKERERAARKGYPSPIHPDKPATDRAFNGALKYCLMHHQYIAFYNATHNEKSNALLVDLVVGNSLYKAHQHINFCQLYGMSDHLTFNLSDARFNVMKYLPYGRIKDVVPYLIRRAQENTAVSGEMGREYQLVKEEVRRRG